MTDLSSLFESDSFGWEKSEKQTFFINYLNELTQHHYQNCHFYRKFLDGLQYEVDGGTTSLGEFPFVPVRLFKELDLRSVKIDSVAKSMTSSGTSGQQVSKIYLDRETAAVQVKVLSKITSKFLGPKRLPMLILDSKSVVSDRQSFSARGAGILGFSILGQDITYALGEDMTIDFPVLRAFLKKHAGKPILLFGFTSILWEHFIQGLKKSGESIDLSTGILIHGGGWKKLQDQAVSNEQFKSTLSAVSGIEKIHNYYGMVEQTGSIFMEGQCGFFHASIYSDVLTRRSDLSLCDFNEPGLIELISLLPKSYPGHVILSEDVGVILGEDDCSCGLKGKYFKVSGRIKNAEIRGCSDTYKS